MRRDIDRQTASARQWVTRRTFLGSLAALAAAPRSFAQTGPPIPVSSINHMTLSVSDPAQSLEWYQGLFGMPVAARQANTVILRVGAGPQFMAIGGGASSAPSINHLCLSTPGFSADDITTVLQRTVGRELDAGQLNLRIRMRDDEFGGAPEGTPELCVEDYDGIVLQLQDTAYCGGEGLLGETCLSTPEPAPSGGLLALRDYNHFTIFVTDQQRTIALYQRLFGMPVDTYQGALPVLRVGSGRAFLAVTGGGGGAQGAFIHHACFSVDDFDVDRILDVLDGYGVTPRGDTPGPVAPRRSYVTMRMPDRGGAPGGTPELYFTDPDGILIQLQDARYCGGNGYLGDECGTPENPTGRG